MDHAKFGSVWLAKNERKYNGYIGQ